MTTDIDPINAAFSAVIKEIRERIGLPPEQFAALLGLGKEQYIDLENPVRNKNLSAVFRVARGLNMEPELLVAATRVHIVELLLPAMQLTLPALESPKRGEPKA
jgi:transcriptional regulator with XRE-family HTH domain